MTKNDARNEQAFVDLRPELFFADNENALEVEKFQNTTLRPVIKLQHNILLDMLIHQPNFDAVLNYKDKRSVFEERIRIFTQQPLLKGLLIGVVVGCFTLEENSFFQKHSKELNKRIHAMLIQRFADSL